MSAPDNPVAKRLASYHRAALAYEYRGELEAFTHDFERDLQLVIVWDPRSSSAAAVTKLVASQATVVARYEVEWSSRHVHRNLERLRGARTLGDVREPTAARCRTMLVVVFEDRQRRYGYALDGSGRPTITNVLAVEVARGLRSLDPLSAGILVSDGLAGFFRTATLLLGPREVERIIGAGAFPDQPVQLRQDLVGANGWRDLGELFEVAGRTSGYVVLRNHEGLTGRAPSDLGDVDLLCSDPVELASSLNARKLSQDAFNAGHECRVDGEPLRLDLHFVGDGYYDRRWQVDMLGRPQLRSDGVVVPRVDDQFFSLLYHVKVHKGAVAERHARTLTDLGRMIGLRQVGTGQVTDDVAAARLLAGFLTAAGYELSEPRDRAVLRGVNRRFVALLASAASLPPGGLRFRRWQLLLRSAARSGLADRLRACSRLRPLARRLERLLLRLGF